MSEASTTGKFVWHDLMTPDREGAKTFYADLLGWAYEIWKPGEKDYPMIAAGGIPLGGMVEHDPAHGVPPHWIGYVEVADLDATLGRATAAGGAVLVPATEIPDVGRFAVIADPTGAACSVMQPGGEAMPPAPPRPGAVAWNELMTTDIAVAAPFYAAVLGWSVREQDFGDFTYTLFGVDGEDVAGGMTRPPGVEAPSHWLTYFQVEDCDGTVARAGELGAQQLWEPMDVQGVGRMAGLADPTGAVFAVFQPGRE